MRIIGRTVLTILIICGGGGGNSLVVRMVVGVVGVVNRPNSANRFKWKSFCASTVIQK